MTSTFRHSPLSICVLLFGFSAFASAFVTTRNFARVDERSTGFRPEFRQSEPLCAVKTDSEEEDSAGPLDDLFQGGLLADQDAKDRASELASSKLRSVSDLGWRERTPRRPSSKRPKLWPFGGDMEKAVQDKPGYSFDNPKSPEPWLGLDDFYAIVKDDSPAADLIFVSLAGGRAFAERPKAEKVLEQWWGPPDGRKRQFDRKGFERTVREGQIDFALIWAAYVGIIGFAGLGLVAPFSPIFAPFRDFIDNVLYPFLRTNGI